MIKYQLIGKEIVSGEYQGRKYQHLKLYCTCGIENNNETLEGQRCEVLKVKKNALGFYGKIEIGDCFKVYYDKFGNVEEISIQD